jgi:hypothetical protein
MNIISINYIVQKDIDEKRLSMILNGLTSNKYKILLNIYDFSLSKRVTDLVSNLKLDPEKIKLLVIPGDYEEREQAHNIITRNFMQYVDSICMTVLHDNLVINNNALDYIDFNILKEETVGFIYPDYNIKKVRCFLRSHSIRTQINTPVIFWSVDKVLRHMAEKDILNKIYGSYSGVHIPNSLCTAYPDEK